MNQGEALTMLKYTLQALSLDADDQIASFEDFVIVTDELVIDFDDAFRIAFSNFPASFNEDQIAVLKKIHAFIDLIPMENKDVSILDELRTYPFWQELRSLAKDALLKFNWSLQIPPRNRAV